MSRKTLVAALCCFALATSVPAASPNPTLGGTEVVAQRTVRLPYSGRELVAVKALDSKTGQVRLLAFEHGVEVDHAAALAAEEEARWAALGNLLPELAARLDSKASEPVEVLIRFAIDEPVPDKSLARSAADQEQLLAAGRAAADRLASRANGLLTAKLERLGAASARVLARSGPFVALALPAAAVRELSRDREIAWMGLHGEKQIHDAPTIAESLPTTRTDLVQSAGNKGAGVKIAVLENGYPTVSLACFNIVAIQSYNEALSSHLTFSPGLIGNRYSAGGCGGTMNGYAPEASVILANGDDYVGPYDYARNQGANVITMSWHYPSEETSGSLSARDKFFDYQTTQPPFPLVFTSAGNQAASGAYASGKGYNIFGVGNVLNDGDGDRCNDVMSASSSFKDPVSSHSDREVPAIASPGTTHDLLGSSFGGTSAATPVTAAIAADILSRSPELKTWPEAMRAILLATANYQGADGLNWSKSAEGKDGTGMTNAYFAGLTSDVRETTSTAQFRGHDYGTLTNASFSGGYLTKTWKAKVTNTNSRVRVALVWNSEVASTPTSVLDADLDLSVVAPSGSTVASSTSYDGAHEFVEFTPSVTGDYTIKVRGVTVPASFTRYYAVAWTVHYDLCD